MSRNEQFYGPCVGVRDGENGAEQPETVRITEIKDRKGSLPGAIP